MGDKCAHCGKDIEFIDKIQHENYSEKNVHVNPGSRGGEHG